MLIIQRLLSLIIGYGFGLFQTGYYVGRFKHVDLRREGSGNSGATNALRVMGLGAGILTFAGDFLKAFAAVSLVKFLFGTANADMKMVFGLYGAIGVALGHNFPFYLGFRGGKGVASTAGAVMACDWRLALIPAIVFLTVTILTRYVSAASLTMMMCFLAETILLGQLGELQASIAFRTEIYLTALFLVVMCFVRHRANIYRLLRGKENKVGSPKIS